MSVDGIDMVLHPPSRLHIAALLAKVSELEFAKLRELTKVSDSVLSKHLTALGDAGYVRLRKAAADGRQRTWASLTRTGKRALDRHIAALHALVADLPTAAE
ncbi:DNA-binding MarR family transcriptional regulator [Sphingomonas sp. BE270]|jgi:DNA-binding MarR family transcriptional regulator|uniref:transcriptional regulator n=1 Tax=Sphingomonas sp. BE270 TaxID=2817726 RepID=UPI00285D05FD|nr:transcriptional regulator [Sphingomonas sp. BE270]MDR7256322.1 DNA-binding MarR family transcriptional regulator [Sphingomonas sp. BE270]